MSMGHQDSIAELRDDWLGAFVYRTVEDLATNDCQYSEERHIAHAETHGKRLEKVFTVALELSQLRTQIPQWAGEVHTELKQKQIDIQTAKAEILQFIDSMPSSKIRERVSDLISYIHWLKARGCTIDPGDVAFLRLNTDEQESFLKQAMKQFVGVYFPRLWRSFLAALNRIEKGKVSFEPYLLPKEAYYFLTWRATQYLHKNRPACTIWRNTKTKPKAWHTGATRLVT